MSQSDHVQHMLESLAAAGEVLEQGAFSLDPYRAVQILREQGRLGQNSLLHLLSAIYTHTGGDKVSRRVLANRGGICVFRWAKPCGPLPASIERLLAEEGFAVQGLRLVEVDEGVRLEKAKIASNKPSLLLEEVSSRLRYYPWDEDIQDDNELTSYSNGAVHVQLIRQAEETLSFIQVVRGVSYPRAWDLPLTAVCYDSLAKADLSLSTIPDSTRSSRLAQDAADHFRQFLKDTSTGAKPCRLNPYREPLGELPLFAAYLGYAVKQTDDVELKKLVSELVFFPAAAGRDWSVGELLKAYETDGKIMVVAPGSVSEDIPGEGLERPVLIWGGQAKRIGSQVFAKTTSGDGYLYSLLVNAKERQRLEEQGEPLIATLDIPGGRIGLLPWGSEDRLAEVEYVGARRSRETYYLDPAAPKGMRIQWESDRSLETTIKGLSSEGPLRQLVLELLSSSLSSFTPSPDALLKAIDWGMAFSPLDWSRLQPLALAPLLELVGGGFASLELCRQTIKERGELPILTDRSSSIPQNLPHLLFWYHPLFSRLEMKIKDCGTQIRQAYFREQGRQSWLAAHSPKAPSWPPECIFEAELGNKRIRIARASSEQAPTLLLFWREGRAFGRRVLGTNQCPPGWLVLWQDDEIEADSYWSGPTVAALNSILPSIAQYCSEAKLQ